jgi:hypothetical protein
MGLLGLILVVVMVNADKRHLLEFPTQEKNDIIWKATTRLSLC